MKTKKEIKAEIQEIDDSLGLLRENWLVCSEKNKTKYMRLINRLLDERLICMSERDAKV